MSKIEKAKNHNGETIFPVTVADAVLMGNGQTLKGKLSELGSEIEGLRLDDGRITGYDVKLYTKNEGYYYQGVYKSSGLYKHTELIPIKKGSYTVELYAPSDSVDKVGFYNKNKEFISSINSGSKINIEVSEDVHFVRFVTAINNDEITIAAKDTLKKEVELEISSKVDSLASKLGGDMAPYATQTINISKTGYVDALKSIPKGTTIKSVSVTRADGSTLDFVYGRENIGDEENYKLTKGIVCDRNINFVRDPLSSEGNHSTVVIDCETQGIIDDLNKLQDEMSVIEYDIESLKDTSNKAEFILIESSEVEEVDYSLFFDEPIDGYVRYTDGALIDNQLYQRTDFIPTKGIKEVYVILPTISNTVGTSFYYSDKSRYADFDGKGNAGFNNSRNGQWVKVPEDASYMCVTKSPSDDNVTFLVKRNKTASLEDELKAINSKISREITVAPRSSNVFLTYSEFGMNKSRETYSSDAFDDKARQIKSDFYCTLGRSDLSATFRAKNSSAYIGIGFEGIAVSEVRVHGNTFEIFSAGTTDGNYTGEGGVIAFTDTMPFNIENGGVYSLGIIKYDNDIDPTNTYNKLNGAKFYCKDCKSGKVYEKYIQKVYGDASQYNGKRSGLITLCVGNPYVSIKQGIVEIINLSLSCSNTPHAKTLIVGDSFIAGDTMIEHGMEKRYCALMQDSIGTNDFVVAGIGGERLNSNTITYIKELIKKFCPNYCIIALGTNNSDASAFKDDMNVLLDWLDGVNVEAILVTITPRNNDSYKAARASINPWVRDSGRLYVDASLAVTGSLDDSSWWMSGYCLPDETHPSILGHQAIYDAFRCEVEEIFK